MTETCKQCGEPIENQGGMAWFHANGLIMCNPTGTLVLVPNKPKTPVSTFRIPLDLKAAAMEKAKASGTDLTAVIVTALEKYVKAK